jgi:hypothetical protein
VKRSRHGVIGVERAWHIQTQLDKMLYCGQRQAAPFPVHDGVGAADKASANA